MQSPGELLPDRIANWHYSLLDADRRLGGYQRRINAIALEFYGIGGTDRQVSKEAVNSPALAEGVGRHGQGDP